MTTQKFHYVQPDKIPLDKRKLQTDQAAKSTSTEHVYGQRELINRSLSTINLQKRKLPTHAMAKSLMHDAVLQMQRRYGNSAIRISLRDEKGESASKEPKKTQEVNKPSASDKALLARVLKKVDDMIRTARKIPGGEYAADNLAYWKSKKGGTKQMPATAFQNQKFIIEWLRGKPRTMFLKGAGTRLKSGELRPGRKVVMNWTDSIYAPEGTPLYYALGGFTIHSEIVVKVEIFSPEEGGGNIVSFISWRCTASDEYNWDKLKSTFIPLYGEINDDELLVLEKYGYGKSFKIQSEPWAVTDPQCLQEVTIQ